MCGTGQYALAYNLPTTMREHAVASLVPAATAFIEELLRGYARAYESGRVPLLEAMNNTLWPCEASDGMGLPGEEKRHSHMQRAVKPGAVCHLATQVRVMSNACPLHIPTRVHYIVETRYMCTMSIRYACRCQ